MSPTELSRRALVAGVATVASVAASQSSAAIASADSLPGPSLDAALFGLYGQFKRLDSERRRQRRLAAAAYPQVDAAWNHRPPKFCVSAADCKLFYVSKRRAGAAWRRLDLEGLLAGPLLPKARARAEKLLARFCEWQDAYLKKIGRDSGYDAAVEAENAAAEQIDDLFERAQRTPAATVAGVAIKALFIRDWYVAQFWPDPDADGGVVFGARDRKVVCDFLDSVIALGRALSTTAVRPDDEGSVS
jgi:hypothetical protein